MKKISLLLFIACLFSLGWADSWQAIRTHSGTVKSIRTEFLQEKHLPILTRPLISRGNLIFQAPASLRWQYSSPVQSLLLLHNGRVRKFSQQAGKLVEERSTGMDGMEMVIGEISLWLTGRFTDNPGFRAELQPGRMIVLTPKEEELSRFISRIELVLGEQPGLMESVTIYEGEDSFTRLTFSNARLNEQIPAAVFTEP